MQLNQAEVFLEGFASFYPTNAATVSSAWERALDVQIRIEARDWLVRRLLLDLTNPSIAASERALFTEVALLVARNTPIGRRLLRLVLTRPEGSEYASSATPRKDIREFSR